MNVLATSQHIWALCIVVLLPLIDLPRVVRLKRHTSTSARLSAYRSALVRLWGAALGAAALMQGRELFTVLRSATDAKWLFVNGWAYAATVSLTCVFFAAGLWPGARCILRTDIRVKYGRAFRRLRFLLPVSSMERLWFVLLSISAGICEEFLYRGFLLEYLRGRMDGGPHFSLTLAWLLTSLAFGTAHLYQGLTGIVTSTVAGLALGAVAILSGGLTAPILLHAVVDLQVLVMYRPLVDSPEEAERLIAGYSAEP